MNVIDHIVNDSSTHVSFSKRFVDLVIFNQNIKKTFLIISDHFCSNSCRTSSIILST